MARMAMEPAMMALVVAMAGMMLPAISVRTKEQRICETVSAGRRKESGIGMRDGGSGVEGRERETNP